MKFTYAQIDEMIDNLVGQINKQYDQVVGIANGGLYISRKIASALNLPHQSVRISFYDHAVPIIEYNSGPIKNCLVVDDLIDGGKTVNKFEEIFGTENDVAVLFWNIKSRKPNYYVQEKPDGVWITFPWE